MSRRRLEKLLRFCHHAHVRKGIEGVVQAPQLRLQVIDDEIIVTLPGFRYSVTYLLTVSEFLGAAWWLANQKAKELGWIEGLAFPSCQSALRLSGLLLSFFCSISLRAKRLRSHLALSDASHSYQSQQ